MTQIKIKKKFKTQKHKPDTRKIISLHVSTQLDEVIRQAAHRQAAHRTEITKQNLIRQMIRHCLSDMNFSIPEDTDYTPPKKRKYKKTVSRKKPTGYKVTYQLQN